MVFAPPIVGLWYWCTDQYIVQRALAGKSEGEARRGTIFAAYLKLLPFFIFLFPGVIAHVLARSGALDLSASDQAFPALVGALLPVGLRGLVAGGLLAALMSSLAAVFNFSSTLFTIDIYKKVHPQASERRLVIVGRLATAVLVVLGILWIPFVRGLSGELYTYLQSVQAYIAPPIAAVFFVGLFWPRINAVGAMAALVGGFVLGMGRLVAEINNVTVLPTLHAHAQPFGPIDREVYEMMKAEILKGAKAAGRVDGIYLDFHGGMHVEGYPDAQVDLIESLRRVLGPEPVAVASWTTAFPAP